MGEGKEQGDGPGKTELGTRLGKPGRPRGGAGLAGARRADWIPRRRRPTSPRRRLRPGRLSSAPAVFPPPRVSRACPVRTPRGSAPSAAAAPPPPPWTAGLRASRLPTAPRGPGMPSAGAAASALGAPGRQPSVRRGGESAQPAVGEGPGRSRAAELPGRCRLAGARPLARGRALGVRSVW